MVPDKVILQSAGSLSVSIIAILMFMLQTLLYLKKRRKSWYAWSAAISFSAVLYSSGIFLEYNTPAGPLNRFSGILEFAALIMLIHCMYGFTFSYLGIDSKKYHLWARIFNCLVMSVLWATDLIVSNEYSTWHFLCLKSPYVEPAIGVLGPLFEAYIAISALFGMVIWIRRKSPDIKYRTAFLSGMGFWIILGIHDGLASLGVPALQYMMEYGFLGFAFAVLWVVINSYIETETDEKYRLITEYANEAIIIIQNGKIVFGNPSFCELTGFINISDSSAGTFYEMLDHQHRDLFTGIFNSLPNKEDPPARHTICIKREDVGARYLDAVITTIIYRGNFAALAVMRDITEQKLKAEELRATEEKLSRLEKMESLGLLAGGVAHDLNNVLSGIINYPELLLLDLPKESKLKKPLEGIKSAGERAVAIVQDLLTIARGVAVQKEPLNINLIIKEYLESPEHEKLNQFHPNVIIKSGLDPELSGIYGSSIHIRKIIMNLVSNASEAIERNGIVMISTMNCRLDKPVRGYDDVKAGDYVMLSIADNGPGIAHDDMERIFEPFYTKKVMGRSGTGLGLSVVWNIVQDHKGYINVSSTSEGTTFTLYFPSAKFNKLKRKYNLPVNDYMGSNEKILVVDDVDSQRDITCIMLNRLGYDTAAVSSGERAVEYIERNEVALVLLDMIMSPGISGKETYEKIIKIRPGQKAVIVSGFAETDDVKATLKMGAGKYVKKPFSLEDIGLAIKDELKK